MGIGNDDVAVFLLPHHEYGTDWDGPSGFYGVDKERTPISPGGSKTWWDFYLWAQNVTLDPPNEVQVETTFDGALKGPPDGYWGHLVIDQVAAGVTWEGPMDYWFDMTQLNTFILPVTSVTDPLQGTRFHLTVYAPPVPEPSSLAALGLAIVGMWAMFRRRR